MWLVLQSCAVAAPPVLIGGASEVVPLREQLGPFRAALGQKQVENPQAFLASVLGSNPLGTISDPIARP
jgi:hypothetical protein